MQAIELNPLGNTGVCSDADDTVPILHILTSDILMKLKFFVQVPVGSNCELHNQLAGWTFGIHDFIAVASWRPCLIRTLIVSGSHA